MKPRLIIGLVVGALGAACSTSEGPALRDRPPAALCVAVEAPTVPAQSGSDLRFSIDGPEFQTLLVEALGQLDAATVVVAAGTPDAANADVVVRPTLEGDPSFQADQSVDWWASGGLWLVTWVGGLVTDDYQYRTAMATNCSLESQEVSGMELASYRLTRPTLTTSFFERNDFMSWPTLQSLVLPPFWTTDDAETTSTALSQGYARAIAEELAKRLKGDFETEALAKRDIELRLVSPERNGGTLTGANQSTLIFRFKSPESPTRVDIQVSDRGSEPAVVNEVRENGLRVYEVTHDLSGLVRGDNRVRIRVETADQRVHTRTLRIRSVDR